MTSTCDRVVFVGPSARAADRLTAPGIEWRPPIRRGDLALLSGIRHVYVADVSDAGCVDFRVVRVVVPELERTRLDCIGPRRLRCVLER